VLFAEACALLGVQFTSDHPVTVSVFFFFFGGLVVGVVWVCVVGGGGVLFWVFFFFGWGCFLGGFGGGGLGLVFCGVSSGVFYVKPAND